MNIGHQKHQPSSRRSWLRQATAGLLLALTGALAPGVVSMAQAQAALPEKIAQTGVLKVAVYNNFPPYHHQGQGLDVDIAQAVAKQLGLKLSLLPFEAGENLNDDLRNMVWKGHYLGYGPADVMIHVPVDRVVMQQNPQVVVLAPYHREVVRVVVDSSQIASYNKLDDLAGFKVGVEGATLAGSLLAGAQNGRFRQNIAVYKSTEAAMQALRDGEVAAVLGQAAELENGFQNQPRYVLGDSPFDGTAQRGWAIGFAVKKDQDALARLIQQAVEALTRSGKMAEIFAQYGVTQRAP